ncbi:hypothetical protein C3486_15220 [Streptomyces sp. Ru73]|uniref:hypothetical protein n=1 Tax=Streptomyces sp. Ru73 TaxID=2080748 RepID=UPI000CDDF556|nr:hypothetical protein [Streptomyces sp. Ru73]POX40159.1 hypothetical protein C3486_15220 [Streptomyces sp. Ru73]
MAWTWRFEKADGTEAAPGTDPEDFTTQGDAESWIGEEWKSLLDCGVDQVTLLEDGAKVYGPMSLHADEGGEGAEAAEG